MPPWSLSQGSVARRSNVPRALMSSPAFLSAVRVRTIEGVARDDASRAAAQRRRIARFCNKRMAGYRVFFAALNDEWLARLPVNLCVGCFHSLRSAIDDDIRQPNQRGQITSYGQTGTFHQFHMFGSCAEQLHAQMCRDLEAPVRTDVGHADELHIVLHPNSDSHAFADDAVAVNGNTYRSRLNHWEFSTPMIR